MARPHSRNGEKKMGQEGQNKDFIQGKPNCEQAWITHNTTLIIEESMHLHNHFVLVITERTTK